MLVYRILTNKHSLKKSQFFPLSTKYRAWWKLFPLNTWRYPHVSNTSCFVFHSWLDKVSFRGPPQKKKQNKKKHIPFKTSSAAGWRRSGSSGASPPLVAPCCASRSPASPGSRGSAAKHRSLLPTWPERHCDKLSLLRRSELDTQIQNFFFSPPHFKKGMFLFTLSRVPARRMPTCCILLEVATDLLQMRGKKKKKKKGKYQKSIWSKMLLDILKIFLKLKLHWLVVNYHDDYSVVPQKERHNSLIPVC